MILWLTSPGWAAAVQLDLRDRVVHAREELSFVAADTFLVSVTLELTRSYGDPESGFSWTDEVRSAQFELIREDREVRYDTADDPSLIGASWQVEVHGDGRIELPGFVSPVSWLDATLVRHLAARTALLPEHVRRARRAEPFTGRELPQAHCDGRCAHTWTVESVAREAFELSFQPVAAEVTGSGTLVVDRETELPSLEYACTIGRGERPTTVLGRLVLTEP